MASVALAWEIAEGLEAAAETVPLLEPLVEEFAESLVKPVKWVFGAAAGGAATAATVDVAKRVGQRRKRIHADNTTEKHPKRSRPNPHTGKRRVPRGSMPRGGARKRTYRRKRTVRRKSAYRRRAPVRGRVRRTRRRVSKFRRTRVTQKKVFGAQYGTRSAFYQDHYNSNEEYVSGTNAVGGNAFTYQEADGDGGTKDVLSMTQYHPMVYDLSHPFQAKQAIYRSGRDGTNSTLQGLTTLNPVSLVSGTDIQTGFNYRLKGRDDLNFATDEPSDLMAQRQVRKIYMKRSKIDIDIHGAGSVTGETARTNPLHFMVVQQLANQGGGEALTAGGDLQTYIQGILGGMKTKAQNNFKLLSHKVFNQAMTTNHNTCKYQYSWKPVDWNRTRYNSADADPDDLVPVGQAAYGNENNHRFLVIFFETGELVLPGGQPRTEEFLDGSLRFNGFIEMKVSKTIKYTPATDVTMDDTDPYGITSMVKSLVEKQMKMTEETQV